ncbi:MAG: Ig-like domain-containing protein [Candidatus Eremiobacterota bacterium]
MLRKLVLLCILAVLAAGCNENSLAPGVALVNVETLTITPGTSTIGRGGTVQLRAIANLFGGGTEDVTNRAVWATSDGNVAGVNATGLVTGFNPGNVDISATLNGVTGFGDVTVSQLNTLTVTPDDRFLQVGTTQQLTATGGFSDGSTSDQTGQATWVSSNPGAATVNPAGLVTGVAPGFATITATAANGVQGQADVNVFAASVREGASATAAGLLPVVDQHRADLGNPLNPNVAGSFGGGRREINWDAVPPAQTNTNTFPSDFFNSNSPRGVRISTPGAGLRVSDNNFTDVNATYAAEFLFFSPVRTFAAIGSNVMNVNFFVPGSATPATTSGFGAVFSDVDQAASTRIEWFFPNGQSFSRNVPALNRGLSFLGVTFTGVEVTQVRLTLGNGVLGAGLNDVSSGGQNDLVITDDFLYGEPSP